MDIDMLIFLRENFELMLEMFEFLIIKEGIFYGLCVWFRVIFGGVFVVDIVEYVILLIVLD